MIQLSRNRFSSLIRQRLVLEEIQKKQQVVAGRESMHPTKDPIHLALTGSSLTARGAVSGRVGKLAQIAKASIESVCKSSSEMTGNIKPRLAPEVLFLLQYQISKSGAVPRPNKGFGKSSVEMTGKKIDRDSLERCYFLLKLVQRRQLALRYVSAVRTLKSVYLFFSSQMKLSLMPISSRSSQTPFE
jgi:hypothetical protein